MRRRSPRAPSFYLASPRSLWLWAALSLLAAPARLFAAAPGSATDTPARLYLEYTRSRGAEGCASPAALARAVERRLGRRVFVPAERADFVAKLHARRAAGRFAVDVELFDRQARSLGRRELSTRGRHCSALDDSLALVVSLAADVTVREPSAAPVTAPLSAPAAPLALGSPIEIPEETHAPRLAWRWRPSAGGVAVWGVMPALGGGAGLKLELAGALPWPLFLRASLWHPQRVGSGAGAKFAAQTLELGVCPWTWRSGGWALTSCAEQLLGRTRATGFGFDQDQAESSAVVALGVDESLAYWFGDWFVSVSGSLLVPLVRRRYFYVDGNEVTLHQEGWAWSAGGLSIGLEL